MAGNTSRVCSSLSYQQFRFWVSTFAENVTDPQELKSNTALNRDMGEHTMQPMYCEQEDIREFQNSPR